MFSTPRRALTVAVAILVALWPGDGLTQALGTGPNAINPSAAGSDIRNPSSINPSAAGSDIRNPSSINPSAGASDLRQLNPTASRPLPTVDPRIAPRVARPRLERPQRRTLRRSRRGIASPRARRSPAVRIQRPSPRAGAAERARRRGSRIMGSVCQGC